MLDEISRRETARKSLVTSAVSIEIAIFYRGSPQKTLINVMKNRPAWQVLYILQNNL